MTIRQKQILVERKKTEERVYRKVMEYCDSEITKRAEKRDDFSYGEKEAYLNVLIHCQFIVDRIKGGKT